MAQGVHDRDSLVKYAVAFAVYLFGGCVIPPSLSVDNQDAGINSPPAILAVRSDQQELPQPGPVLFDRGHGSLSVTLIDTDLTDKLYVRVFVGYTVAAPTAPRSTCTASGETATRTAMCDLAALCLPADVGQERLMSILVFDRMPLESGSPPFQAMDPPGITTNRIYQLKCQEPSS